MIITEKIIDLIECDDAPAWMADNNAYGMTEKQVLDLLKSQNSNFYEPAKSVFEWIRGSVIKESGAYTVNEYKIISIDGTELTYLNETDLKDGMFIERKKILNSVNPNFSVNFVQTNENGDQTWLPVDMETWETEGLFKVFNPVTGLYLDCESISDAKNSLKQAMQEVLNAFMVNVQQNITGTSGDTKGDSGWVAMN